MLCARCAQMPTRSAGLRQVLTTTCVACTGNWESTASRITAEGATSVAIVLTSADVAAACGADGCGGGVARGGDAVASKGLVSREMLALALLRVGGRDNHVGARRWCLPFALAGSPLGAISGTLLTVALQCQRRATAAAHVHVAIMRRVFAATRHIP
jgi:hypothetical protein